MPLPLLAILAAMGGIAGTGAAIGASRRAGKPRNPLEDDPNADVVDEGQDGGFMSFLESFGRPGKVVNNALMGNFEGAGRQLLDLGGDIIDAPLPGDWIKPISRRQDKPEFSDVVGGMEPGLGKFAIDVLGGAATDPTMLIPGAAVGKAAGAIGKGVQKGINAVDKVVPGVADQAAKLGRNVRSVFGARRDSPAARGIHDKARAGQGEAAAGIASARVALEGLDERQLNIVGDLVDNFRWQDGKLVGELVPSSVDPVMGKRTGSILDRALAHPDIDPAEAERLAKVADDLVAMSQNQKARKGIFSANDQANLSDEYLMRSYEGLPENEAMDFALGGATSTKERSLKGFREVAGFLGDNPKVRYERNALKRSASRAEQQGELARRADVGAGIMDAVRQGKLALPDKALEDVAAGMSRERFPVGASGADPIDMLGAKMAAPTGSETYGVAGQSGRATAPPTPFIDETVPDPYGIGTYSGRSKPPTGGKSARPVDLLLKGDLAGARKAVEAMAKNGEIDETTSRLYLNMLDDAAAGTDEVVEVADDAASALDDPYGLGSVSGRARPPKSKPVDPSPPDPYGLGSPSGKSVAPRADNGFDSLGQRMAPRSGAEAYGLGEQSGQAVVGKSTVKQPFPAAKETANARGYTPEQMDKARAQVLSKDFALADPDSKSLVNGILQELSKTDPESARGLMDAFNGLAPRGAAMGVLAKANRVVKPMMVYGAFIPKFGAIVRNRLSGAWQALSNPEARGQAAKLANPLRVGSDLLGALDDGITQTFGFQRLNGSALTKNIDAMDQAMRASGGSLQNAMGMLPPDLADAVRTGVMDGFVSSEQLVKEMGRTPFKKQFFNVMNWPGRVFKGVEDRMRLGMFLDLKKTMPAEEAARVTRDTFYDYSVASAGNRAMRDIIPFFQFPAKAIVQQGKFLAEQPAVGGALSRATEHDPDQPVYPWMEGKLNVPIGENEDGTQDFISGFGLPFEALNAIPDLSNDMPSIGRSLERDTIGATQPMLKSAFGLVSGEDPYFQSQFGSYDKIPLVGEAGDLGKAYNVAAGTGLLQPVDSPLRTLGKAFDDRRDLGTKALDLLTGANVVSVDPDLALRQQLQALLEANPDVRQHRSFYGDAEDEPTQRLLAAYQAAKARLKAKRAGAPPL